MIDLFDPADPRPHWRPDTIFDAVREFIAHHRRRRFAARHHRKMLAAFEREAQRADAALELLNATGMRRYNLGDSVTLDSCFCPRCDCYTGRTS